MPASFGIFISSPTSSPNIPRSPFTGTPAVLSFVACRRITPSFDAETVVVIENGTHTPLWSLPVISSAPSFIVTSGSRNGESSRPVVFASTSVVSDAASIATSAVRSFKTLRTGIVEDRRLARPLAHQLPFERAHLEYDAVGDVQRDVPHRNAAEEGRSGGTIISLC